MSVCLERHPDDIILKDNTSGYILPILRTLNKEELDRGSVKVNLQTITQGDIYTEVTFRVLTSEEIKKKKTKQLIYIPYRIYNTMSHSELRAIGILGKLPTGKEEYAVVSALRHKIPTS